jgi:hypothetical protein
LISTKWEEFFDLRVENLLLRDWEYSDIFCLFQSKISVPGWMYNMWAERLGTSKENYRKMQEFMMSR